MQLRRVPFWAVTVELFLPFHHVCLAPVLLDQPAHVAALALATRAFDSQCVELAFDVTEYEIGTGHYLVSVSQEFCNVRFFAALPLAHSERLLGIVRFGHFGGLTAARFAFKIAGPEAAPSSQPATRSVHNASDRAQGKFANNELSMG